MYRGIIFFLNKTLSAKILHVLLKSTWGITPLGTWLVKGGYEPFIARLRRSLGDENDHHGYDHHFLVMGSWWSHWTVRLGFCPGGNAFLERYRDLAQRGHADSWLPVKNTWFLALFFFWNLVQTAGTSLPDWSQQRVLQSTLNRFYGVNHLKDGSVKYGSSTERMMQHIPCTRWFKPWPCYLWSLEGTQPWKNSVNHPNKGHVGRIARSWFSKRPNISSFFPHHLFK